MRKKTKFNKRSQFLSRVEILEHQKLYKFYNSLWGDHKEKVREYLKKNHERRMEYQRQYRAKKNPSKEFSSVLFDGVCDRNCESCIYDDCILPTWESRKEYDALYYQKNRERIKAWHRQYYEEHKEEILAKQREHWVKKGERNLKRKVKTNDN